MIFLLWGGVLELQHTATGLGAEQVQLKLSRAWTFRGHVFSTLTRAL